MLEMQPILGRAANCLRNDKTEIASANCTQSDRPGIHIKEPIQLVNRVANSPLKHKFSFIVSLTD